MVFLLVQQEQQQAGHPPGQHLVRQTWLQAQSDMLPDQHHGVMLQQQALQKALPGVQPEPDPEWLLVLQPWLPHQLAVLPAGQHGVAVLPCLLMTLRQQLHCLQTLQAGKANQ